MGCFCLGQSLTPGEVPYRQSEIYIIMCYYWACTLTENLTDTPYKGNLIFVKGDEDRVTGIPLLLATAMEVPIFLPISGKMLASSGLASQYTSLPWPEDREIEGKGMDSKRMTLI